MSPLSIVYAGAAERRRTASARAAFWLAAAALCGSVAAGAEPPPPRADVASAEGEDAAHVEGEAKPGLAEGARGRLATFLREGLKPARVHLRLRAGRAGVYRAWLRVRVRGRVEFRVSVNAGDMRPCYVDGRGTWQWVTPHRTLFNLRPGVQTISVESKLGNLTLDRVLLVRSREYEPTGLGPVGSLPAPAQEVYFIDRFERKPDEASPWTTERGDWEITKFFEKTDPKRASNAFTFLGRTPQATSPPAIAVTGKLVWRDYAGEVSAGTVSGTGRFGVVFNYVDAQNHYRAVFTADPAGGTARLIRVAEGEEHVLAARDGWLRTRQFYRLEVDAVAGDLAVLVDGHEILRAEDSTFLAGRFGLLAQGAEGVYFDDVQVRSQRYAAFDFSTGIDPSRWEADAVFASAGAGVKTSDAAGAVVDRIRPGMKRGDLAPTLHTMHTGTASWQDYTIEADVRQPMRCMAGLVVGADKEGKGYALLRLHRGQGRGAVYVLKAMGEEDAVLARSERQEANGMHTLSLSTYRGVVSAAADGRRLFEAYVGTQAARGHSGLVASAAGVHFSNLSVRFGRKAPPAVAANPIFRKDRYMKDWAPVTSEWEMSEDKRLAWSRRDFYGNGSIAYDLAAPLPTGGALELLLGGDGDDRNSGYRLRVAAGEAAELDPRDVKVSLWRGETQVDERRWRMKSHDAEADEHLPGSQRHGLQVTARFSLARWGRAVVALQEDEEIFVWQDPEPLEGLHCGAGLLGQELDVNRIRVTSDQLFNDTFTEAPIHWRRAQGDWRMKNRFWCAPQWSWYGGRSKECAAVWHKDAFPGDFTLDVYMSMQMDKGGRPHYLRPGFQNITVCGDGKDLDSGYSLVYGVDHGQASILLRRDEEVLRSTEDLARPPPNYKTRQPMTRLHRRWWHWQCAKQGGHLRWYLDGELLFDYEDPAPLAGDRIALWTEHRGIMISRARISYADKGAREAPLLSNPPQGLADTDASPSTSGPLEAYVEDFDASMGAWQPTGRENSARLRRVPRKGKDAKDPCLEMTNRLSGGDMGVRCVLPTAVDLLRTPWLSLDMRCDPDARLNLYVRCGEHWYSLRLTGHPDTIDSDLVPNPATNAVPGRGTRLIRTAGAFQGLEADGAWHSLAINLGDALRERARGLTGEAPERLMAEEFFLGNLDVAELSQSGFGCNHQGTTYAIDRVRLFRAANKDLAAPPAAEAVGAVDGRGCARIRIPCVAGGPWIDLDRLALEVVTQGRASQRLDGEALWRGVEAAPDRSQLVVDLNALGVGAPAGDAVTIKLHRLGWRGQAETTTRALTFPVALDENPQTPQGLCVELPGQPAPWGEDFHKPFAQWTDGRVLSAWDRKASPAGPGSLRMVTLQGGTPFRGQDLATSLDLATYPVLSWWYCAEPGVRLDLHARIGGQPAGVAFLNEGQGLSGGRLGAVDGVDDGTWHWTAFNLGQAFCRTTAAASGVEVKRLAFQDFGWLGSADGMNYWLDGLTGYPFVKPDEEGRVRVRLCCRGIAGAQAFRYVVQPMDEPPPALTPEDRPEGVRQVPARDNEAVIELAGLRPGVHALHWAARNRAGWSTGPVHFLPLDTQAPRLALRSPELDQRAAPKHIQCTVQEEGFGLRPDSVRLRVAGRAFATTAEAVAYTPANGTLLLDTTAFPRRAAGAFADDGERIPVALEARDLAGNPLAASWEWVMDYSQDKTPPPAPPALWTPAEGYVRLPHVPAEDALPFAVDAKQTRIRVLQDEKARAKVLQIEPAGHRRSAGLVLAETPMDLRKGLHLRFRWRAHGHFRSDVRFHVDKKVYVLRFLDNQNFEAKHFASLPDIKRDGLWHQASFDVGAALHKALPEGAKPVVTKVELGKPGSRRNHKGWWLRLADLALFSRKHLDQGVWVYWDAVSDPTGVLYAASVDTKSAATPTDGYTADKLAQRLTGWAPGSVVHVAARDRAGNTAVTHLPLPEGPPAPAAPDGDKGPGTPAPAEPGAWEPGGLYGEYFQGVDFDKRLRRRLDPVVDFAWGGGPAHPDLPADQFSVRWTGRIRPDRDGVYTFHTRSDDGVRLWVAGRLLIGNWTSHGTTEDTGSIELAGGKSYAIKLEYYEQGGGATMQLLWSRPGLETVVIPQARLLHRRALEVTGNEGDHDEGQEP